MIYTSTDPRVRCRRITNRLEDLTQSELQSIETRLSKLDDPMACQQETLERIRMQLDPDTDTTRTRCIFCGSYNRPEQRVHDCCSQRCDRRRRAQMRRLQMAISRKRTRQALSPERAGHRER